MFVLVLSQLCYNFVLALFSFVSFLIYICFMFALAFDLALLELYCSFAFSLGHDKYLVLISMTTWSQMGLE